MSENVVVEIKNKVCYIVLKREKKYNSITGEMYRALAVAFDEADKDENVMLTVLTGSGLYFSAGSDFSPAELQHMGESATPGSYFSYKIWVDTVIKHRKPVIALVNGNAVGIGVTILGLCDAVFATNKATFWCPFSQLGLNPEAGSSLTFPTAMGHSKAAQLIMFSERMTAEEAYVAGLVTKVFPHDKFIEETKKVIESYSKLGQASLMVAKKLLRPKELVDKLLTVNRHEHEVLLEQMNSDETLERIMNKFAKSKV